MSKDMTTLLKQYRELVKVQNTLRENKRKLIDAIHAELLTMGEHRVAVVAEDDVVTVAFDVNAAPNIVVATYKLCKA